ncbi:uncharacterized protein LOC129749882 [Uranotaenia lowii]|uniref:uncharacterized protein LOC129749882 n=1 Tax=Uranotaenia lowii TaxID=190385 RepID=UPI00247978BC|nr:uncharacterized protein LOC129749882 [Uranotaenia lowii]XP_055600963.1 uncharacterized protein LOC129749882 [Uranotaenia lowii]XP_055600964.1 uncharacterized protein LOC129749882 [Uranotaenia lowii]XP_055600966.1 uncharacterized protein LOC129749882 [Uranotaenia lowii]XP_055600967.1 uncharacterized protein LOC129749882 [Uranotaenia lowii]XP_055600968.1 uncharacterized protein LOC129749882 [Uranotaenia lowii]XP_055600969.1 uncharacterized protein LOC129749882 [Uranotaenia lowii]XP_05560097
MHISLPARAAGRVAGSSGGGGRSNRGRIVCSGPGKILLCCVHILLVLINDALVTGLRKGRLMVPATYMAQTDDLHIQLQIDSGELMMTATGQDSALDLKLQISLVKPTGGTTISLLEIKPDVNHNVTQIKIPCRYFMHGGLYELSIERPAGSAEMDIDERLRQQLNVSWPTPTVSLLPSVISTYPEEIVRATLQFPDVHCPSAAGANDDSVDVPEFWLELVYCGRNEACPLETVSKPQILFSEQVRGFPSSRVINFRCDLFGLAGYYLLHLRTTNTDPNLAVVLSGARALLKADWSKEYVFTVHARSIFPCDAHSPGIRVLFQYPSCILNQSDRVRVYAKLRADVSSLVPPTSLHYIAEQRVTKGQHALYFECDLFYEKYIEYCFVYVSQAISGAVADVRMDCVPTLPVSPSDSGGWGPWSNWTHCSTTCRGGVRNRYRFCDSPPPRYGAKFCEGPSVQTERCGKESTFNSWECMFSPGPGSGTLPAQIADVSTEVGPACRCGCIIHLGVVKPKRIIASSSESCPERSLWLVQGDEEHRIRFTVDFSKFPCDQQWLKVRDGDKLSQELILEYASGHIESGKSTESSGSRLLVEFHSKKMEHYDENCIAGFLGQAEQIKIQYTPTNVSVSIASKVIMPFVQSFSYENLTIAHICAIVFISFIIFVSFILLVQYMFRYRKYELATTQMEVDSPAHTPFGSGHSLNHGQQPRSRAMSTTTLISEIVSYVKLRPKTGIIKHHRFRESIEYTLESTDLPSDGSLEHSAKEDNTDRPVDEIALKTLGNSENPGQSETSECNSPTHVMESCYSDDQSTNLSSAYSTLNREKTPLVARKDRKKTPEHRNETKSEGEHSPSEKIMMASSSSTVTLTNISPSDVECCSSPAPSVANNNARIRPNNLKESKEKRNLQKLLAGSDFSLGHPEDMEMDYYDYNVINAGAAPGSYLGMDPAYLVWIPPLNEDDDNISGEVNLEQDTLGEGDTGSEPRSSNTTPNEEIMKILQQQRRNDYLIVNSISKSDIYSETEQADYRATNNGAKKNHLQELALNNATRRRISSPPSSVKDSNDGREKETSFTKSPVDNKQIADFYEMADIQFADDEADEGDEDDEEATPVDVTRTRSRPMHSRKGSTKATKV